MSTTNEKKQPVPRVRKDGAATRMAILLAAEKLFSHFGFDGVSIRDITKDSNVDLALVNYHFKSKENLFHEVLAMRVDDMNEKRMALIESVEIKESSRETLIDLFDAFCKPFSDGPKAKSHDLENYRRLVGLVSNSRRWQTEIFQKHYDPIVDFLVQKISEILPKSEKSHIYWSVSFFLGSLANAYADTRRVDRLSGGLCNSSNLESLKKNLILYSVGGLIALSQSLSDLD